MLNVKFLVGFVLVSLLVFTQGAIADDFLDSEPLLRDVTSVNPGLELVVPVIDMYFDTETYYATKFFVKFNVFDAGTKTLLFSTPRKGFTTAAIPCSEPDWVDFDFEPKFLETDTHTGMGILMYTECQDVANNYQWEEVDKTFIYMAETSQQGGTAWGRAWNFDAMGFDMRDFNGGGDLETIVSLWNETETGETVRNIVLNTSTGSTVNDKTYTMIRYFAN